MALRDGSEEKLIMENQGLIYSILKEMEISWNNPEYDDLVSIGQIGLIKAIRAFDESRNLKISTFAAVCIKNEIKMYFRKQNRNIKNCISLQSVISTDGKGSELKVEDILVVESNFIENLEELENFMNIVNIIFNFLTEKERVVMIYRISGCNQRYISEKLGLTQSYISRIQKKGGEKINSYIKRGKIEYIKYLLDKENNIYKFIMNKKLNKKLINEVLMVINEDKNVKYFNIVKNKEKTILEFSFESNWLFFLNNIIGKIEGGKLII